MTIRNILIDAQHGSAKRIAIVEDTKLVEFDCEYDGSDRSKGHVFVGVVNNIETSLGAVFITYSDGKSGLLAFNDIHPAYLEYDNLRDVIEHCQNVSVRRSISAYRKRMFKGRKILVQIVREERGGKSAALTTQISIPGRYLVLLPFAGPVINISSNITKEVERTRLKTIIKESESSEVGVLIRTISADATKHEIKKDLHRLLKIWSDISIKSIKADSPCMVYRNLSIINKTVIDWCNKSTEFVTVQGEEAYHDLVNIVKSTMHGYLNKIRLHDDSLGNIFNQYDIEKELSSLYEPKVILQSGGYIMIQTTEALTAIDVNSSKSKNHADAETAACSINLEAAIEIGRQIRLRNIGGIIVIDFIHMAKKDSIDQLMITLNRSLKSDKAKIKIVSFSKLGLVEISRQRIGNSYIENSIDRCEKCSGKGFVKGISAVTIDFISYMQNLILQNKTTDIHLRIGKNLFYYLANTGRHILSELEKKHNINIRINMSENVSSDHFELIDNNS